MAELEQPELIENQNCNSDICVEGEQNNVAINEESKVHQEIQSDVDDVDCGSKAYLGKFNSVQDLVSSYNSLQAEFTRKCQKLKMVEDGLNANKEKNNLNGNAQEDIPLYLQEDYNEKLNSFLTKFPNAKKYSKEISLEIMLNKNLDLQQAYNNVLATRYREPEELVKDKNFIENYILNDNEVKKELIKKYLKDVKESNAPTLISGANGAFSGRTKDIEISSLEEANKLALKMFKG